MPIISYSVYYEVFVAKLGNGQIQQGAPCALTCALISTGEACCSEDAEAANTVNKFLAEELARACRNNKSHKCFSSDLQAFKSSEHVSKAIKMGLEGLETYAQVCL